MIEITEQKEQKKINTKTKEKKQQQQWHKLRQFT